jgi:colanic acid biosynthesis glycosyl transferase WcaI
VLHLLTFAVTSIPLMVRAIFWRPDLVWMAAPAFVCAPAALLTAKFTGARSWIHIQDFEIDIAFGMGIISGGGWKSFVTRCERALLRRFDRVSTISKAMVTRAVSKGVPRSDISYVPNWADVDAVTPLRAPSAYRAELGIPDDAVVALYSGSMGLKQGVDWVAEAALKLQAEPKLYVVLCGEGPLKDEAQKVCGHLPNVRFLPFQPLERLGELLGLADIHLLPQRADAAEMVMPSKLTGMLASGRSVVGMADAGTELAEVVQICGRVVPHGDVPAFASAILDLAGLPQLRAELGRTARAFADNHLAAHTVISKLEAEMVALVSDGEVTSPAPP